MKKIIPCIIGLLLMVSSSFAHEGLKHLMPMPQKIVVHAGSFQLDSSFQIRIDGPVSGRINSYATQFLNRLRNRTGLFMQQPVVNDSERGPNNAACVFSYTATPGFPLQLGEDESYVLTVQSGLIKLTAKNDLGILRGMETLYQLLSINASGYYFPNVTITDAPRFPWRGLMLDVSRHFLPVDAVKRNLRAMASMKMNVLHWHLADDQGFRVESKTFPKLHEMGSDGLFFTQNQITDIIRYADELGIRVIPEFDVPGHSTAWFVGYPEYASAPGPYKIERNWGVFDPTFNPAMEETYQFFDILFTEMCNLFPDAYFHIGGDENNGKQWDANSDIQDFMKKNAIRDNHELQAYFNKRLLDILTKNNKKMIGWDEILEPSMPTNIVIQSWRGRKSLVEAAQKGYMGLLSNGYYIDLIQSTEFHYLNDPIGDDSPLNDEQKKLILGGEATMWAELVTDETVDSRIWPRTAAIAERFWSDASVKDVDDMYRRMNYISFLLEDAGTLHSKNYEMMLRRLTNNQDISALKQLCDLLEPVKIYTRHSQGKKYTSFSPYSRIVDAARPESMCARSFRQSVDRFIENPRANRPTQLKEQLNIWLGLPERLQVVFVTSPIAAEIKPQSQNLAKLADFALQAINAIDGNTTLANSVYDSGMAAIAQAKKPVAQTELMIVSAVEKLLKAASSRN